MKPSGRKTLLTQLNEQSDRSLVERAIEGESSAMEAIYRRHSGAVYSMALRFTGQVSDAEDVVQETFIKAFKSLAALQDAGALKSWLLGIGINLSRDLYRRRTRLVPVGTPPASTAPAGGDVLTRRWLERCLQQLPEGYREVLTLHDVLGLKHSEIAKLLNLAEGTSKSQLHKARANLRALLQRDRQTGCPSTDTGR